MFAKLYQLTVCSAFLADPCDGSVFDILGIRTGALGAKTDAACCLVSILSLSEM